jgi:hypothetical protein
MTYLVQIQLGSSFRDVYVSAKSDADAIRAARKLATQQELRWAAFVL